MGILSDIRRMLIRRKGNVTAINREDITNEIKEINFDNTLSQNEVIDDNEYVDKEREELLSKIDKNKFNELCNKYFKDESYFSNFFLGLLSNNEFIDYLCDAFIISSDLLDSINNNTYNINSIDRYNRILFKYLPFNDEDKVIIDMINKGVNLSGDNYYMVSSNDLSDIGSNKEIIEEKIASLFPGIEIITNKREVLPIDNIIFEDSLIKIINPVNEDEVIERNNNSYYDGNLKIDENTIIVMDYDKFMELSKDKDFINKYSKCMIVFGDDFDTLQDISNKFINNIYNNFKFNLEGIESIYNGSDIKILINHLLYIVNNSDLDEEKKNKYRYFLSDYYYMGVSWLSFYKFEDLAKDILKDCNIDYVKNITLQFNKLSLEEKSKDIKKYPFNYDMFITSINNFDNIDVVSLLRIINNLNKENKKIILDDKRIKNKIRDNILKECNNDQWDYYRKLFVGNLIDINYFFSIVDGDYINEYYSNNRDRYAYILFGSICEADCNKLVQSCLKDIELFKLFHKEVCKNSFSLSLLTYENLLNIINLTAFIKGDYSFIRSISTSMQYKLLEESFDDDVIVGIINNCYKYVVQYFVDNDERFERLYKKINIVDNYNKIKYSPDFLSKHSKYIFDKLYDKDLINYRFKIDKFNRDNTSLDLLDRFDRYEEDIINSFDVDKEMFSYYLGKLNSEYILGGNNYLDIDYNYLDSDYDLDDINGRIQFFKRVSIFKLSDVVVDKLFKDNIYNVHLNIGEMLRYNSFLEDSEKVLDDNSIKFYNSILNITSKSGKEIINLYNSVKDKNIDSMFYDDIRMLKDKSYDNIKSVLFSPDSDKYSISKELSSKYKVPIYDLRDGEYTMLVRCLNTKYEESARNRRDCYTLMSDLNSKVLHSDNYIYGYSNFDNDCVLHIFEADAFSSDVYDDNNKLTTSTINRIMTPEQIVLNDSNISEVQILNKMDSLSKVKESLKPDFICVYDDVNDKVLEEARRLNIPVVIIRDNKLAYGLNGDIAYDSKYDDYIFSGDVDLNRRIGRK